MLLSLNTILYYCHIFYSKGISCLMSLKAFSCLKYTQTNHFCNLMICCCLLYSNLIIIYKSPIRFSFWNHPLAICSCNIHFFLKLWNRKLQEESEESYFPLPIYTSECPSCSSQFFVYPSANSLSLIARRFSALFSEFLS